MDPMSAGTGHVVKSDPEVNSQNDYTVEIFGVQLFFSGILHLTKDLHMFAIADFK